MGKMNPRTSFLDHIGSSAASSETEKVLGAEEREGDRDWEGEGSRQKEERGTRKREGELKARDLIHLHAPQRLFQMSHHADVCRHISGSFQAEEWEVDDVQARGMCFSPILKSHSTRGCGLNARVLSRIHAET
ncbi:uncharacterized protein [Macaca nemestrina]|uniref:uncharacterized protein isoform X1 n=1 Tax=Macaca nemestrina TaxID=9545 RepID=UPI0039B89B92